MIIDSLLQEKSRLNKKSEVQKPEPPKLTMLNIVGITMSIFSVIFTTSVLNIIDEWDIVVKLIAAFLLIIIALNEYVKVKSISTYWRKRQKRYLALMFLTLIISLSSLYGIYVSINKTKDYINTNIKETETVLETKKSNVQNKIDSLINLKNRLESDNITLTKENKDISSSWRPKEDKQSSIKANNEAIERNDKMIADYEKRINKLNESLSKDEQKLSNSNSEYKDKKETTITIISFIVMFLSLIVEAAIVAVNIMIVKKKMDYEKEVIQYKEYLKLKEEERKNRINNLSELKEYIKFNKVIEIIFKTKSLNETFYRSEFESLLSSDTTQEDMNKMYRNLQMLKIITGQKKGVKISTTKEQALELIKDYYNTVLDTIVKGWD